MILKYIVENTNYTTIKDVVKKQFHISKRLLIKLKNNNKIFLNKKIANINSIVSINDCIEVVLDFEEESDNIIPLNMKLDIIYEDDYFLIINKPANVAIHPSCSHYENSLSNGVKYYFNSIGLKKKIRPVNRLDKDTTGIVIFAKNEYIQEALIKQMQNKVFTKEYIAILDGVLKNSSGTICAPICRKDNSIIERCVSPSGEIAITHYSLIKNYNNLSIVKFILETGRTHQIRVHCQHIGHPILGDTLYGTCSELINRQALHAYRVSFVHPIYNKNVEFIAQIPEDMKKLI